jgi:hypothetical protein
MIWSLCYHLGLSCDHVLSSGMITPPFFIFPENFTHSYKSLTETGMKELGTRPRSFISGNICFEFSVQFLRSVVEECEESGRRLSFYLHIVNLYVYSIFNTYLYYFTLPASSSSQKK